MKKNNSFLDRLFMALVFVFLYAPIVLLIVFSFNSGNSNMVWKGFSLHWYTKLFRNRIIMQSVYTTLMVSLLATIIGVTNVIPFFGPFIGAIPCGLLVFLDSPIKCVYFAIFILVLQQFDGNILGPKILGDSTGLASFWVLFSILLFGGLFGFAGMVLGVPVFAMFYSVVNRLVRYGLGKRKLPVETQEYLGRTGPLSRPKE